MRHNRLQPVLVNEKAPSLQAPSLHDGMLCVPQQTVYGPWHFLLYIHDISTADDLENEEGILTTSDKEKADVLNRFCSTQESSPRKT